MNILIQNLEKRYKNGFQAIKNISLEIKNGMFGLLGPNGAGKTTLMKILVTLLNHSAGSIKFDDFDIKKNRAEIRKILGYLPQSFNTFSRLTVWEFLEYSAVLSGINSRKIRLKKVEELLESVHLYEFRDRRSNKLSGGMKRRLGIAQALIGSPKVLIVDEPTTGLDPEERIKFRNLMGVMSQKEMIIILSTHIVGDISSSCEQMAMLNKGNLVFNGSPKDIIKLAKGNVWSVEANDL